VEGCQPEAEHWLFLLRTLLIGPVALLGFADDSRRAAALPRMLPRSAKVPQPPLGVRSLTAAPLPTGASFSSCFVRFALLLVIAALAVFLFAVFFATKTSYEMITLSPASHPRRSEVQLVYQLLIMSRRFSARCSRSSRFFLSLLCHDLC
jgi:hypothetical protein